MLWTHSFSIKCWRWFSAVFVAMFKRAAISLEMHHFPPAQLRQRKVENHQVGMLADANGDCLKARPSLANNFVCGFTENNRSEQFTDRHLVIHNHDSFFHPSFPFQPAVSFFLFQNPQPLKQPRRAASESNCACLTRAR